MDDENNFLGLQSNLNSEEKKAVNNNPAVPSESDAIPPWFEKKYAIITIFIGIFFIVFIYQIFIPISADDTPFRFEIQKGESLQGAIYNLKKENLTRSIFFIEWYARIRYTGDEIQAGSYVINKNQSPAGVLKILFTSPSSNELVIVIPEGWTVRDIATFAANQKLFSEKDFFDVLKADFSSEFSFLSDTLGTLPRTKNVNKDKLADSLQGYLFPDTYRVFKDTKPEDVIRKMLQNFDRKLTKGMRDEILIQRKSIFEIVTMASMIEKEVRTPEDKAIVSGVLWKRLQLGIPLQVDATIVFIKSGGKSQLKNEKVLYEDLKIDSPYNTYQYRGLPIGPISNPGKESIEATIYPKQSPYFYYLSSSDGKTIFSKTLEEHNSAKAKYLR